MTTHHSPQITLAPGESKVVDYPYRNYLRTDISYSGEGREGLINLTQGWRDFNKEWMWMPAWVWQDGQTNSYLPVTLTNQRPSVTLPALRVDDAEPAYISRVELNWYGTLGGGISSGFKKDSQLQILKIIIESSQNDEDGFIPIREVKVRELPGFLRVDSQSLYLRLRLEALQADPSLPLGMTLATANLAEMKFWGPTNLVSQGPVREEDKVHTVSAKNSTAVSVANNSNVRKHVFLVGDAAFYIS